jgi:SOS-response transcriptional repressor LexA
MGMNTGQKWNALAKSRMKEIRVTQEALAEKLGVTQGAIGHWLNGRREPSIDIIISIFNALGMPGVKFNQNGEVINDGDAELTPASIGLRKIPIINEIQAGCWTESIECRSMDGSIETINTDLDLGSMAFALSVRGDSMAPEILEGDVVVIDPDVDPLPGDIVAAKNGNHEATLKQFRPRGTNDQGLEYFELVPRNPVYPSMRSDHNHVTIIGTMMEHRRYRKKR